jgi:tellurite resistance protein TehA-like permease
MRVALGVAIAVWTLAAWGGRIGLLTSDEGVLAWVRVGGSLLVGLFAAATLLVPQLEGARRWALIVFSLFTLILWVRSLIVTWAGDGTLPFKLVHTVLAIGFFSLALWAFSFGAGATSSDPETAEAHQDADG